MIDIRCTKEVSTDSLLPFDMGFACSAAPVLILLDELVRCVTTTVKPLISKIIGEL